MDMQKRWRGRPRNEDRPGYVPPEACSNCRREPCTSGLNERVRKMCKDRKCVNYLRWPKEVKS